MLKVYLHVLIFLSLGMLTYIMFLGNEYMRGKNPIRSIILITNSRFDRTNHRMDTKNTDQSGIGKNLADGNIANIVEKQNLSRELLNFTTTKRATVLVTREIAQARKNFTITKQKTTLKSWFQELEIFQARQSLVYKLASEFYKGTDLSIMEPKQDLPLKEINQYTEHNLLHIQIGKTQKTSYNLGKPIPPSAARHILLTSSFGRSGSSFIGQMLSHYPGTFYSFEPEHVAYRTPKHFDKIPDILQQVFKCKPDWGYFNYEYSADKNFPWAHFVPNFRFWNAVQYLKQPKHLTSMVELYRATCPVFPIRLIKTIFMPVHDVEKSLNDAEISKNLKVIILFRDPRGMFQSINKIRKEKADDWSQSKAQQDRQDPAKLCEKMKLDAENAFALRDKYPGKIYVVRYEDMCLHPHATISRLLNFLDLSWNKLIGNFIDQYTTVEQRNGDPYSTRRDSKYTAFKWTKLLKTREISEIQKVCSDPMKILGYNIMQNIRVDKRNKEFPILVKSAKELWPDEGNVSKVVE